MSAHSEVAKQFFKTGLKPTEAQFAQQADWQRWKDEPIAYADLTAELQAFFGAVRNTVSRVKLATTNTYTVVDGDEIVIFKNVADYVEIALPAGTVHGRKLTFILGCDSSGFPTPITPRPVLKFASDVTANGLDGASVAGANVMVSIVWQNPPVDFGPPPFWQIVDLKN